MDEANQIFSYLPLRYKNNGEAEYVQYLWKAFESNYENEQYQFAFMAYHMLFMSFVYFSIWKIKSIHPDDYRKISLGFKDCFETASDPFSFCAENERTILTFFRFWGIGKEKIGNYKKLIDTRNDIAHSSGNIYFQSIMSIDNKIDDILNFCKEIHEETKITIEQAYKQFLIDNPSVNDSPYIDTTELLNEEFIHKHYISEADMTFCVQYDVIKLVSEDNFGFFQQIHNEIIELFKSEN